MRRGYAMRKIERKHRKPAELLLVPMIDIFTVLVTFLLMTAVFSRTVIMELKLPVQSSAPMELSSVFRRAASLPMRVLISQALTGLAGRTP